MTRPPRHPRSHRDLPGTPRRSPATQRLGLAALMLLAGCTDGCEDVDWSRVLVGLHMIQRFEEEWGLEVESPPIKHDEDKGLWASIIYYDGDVYELTLTEGNDTAVAAKYEDVQWPEGTITVLVVGIAKNNVSLREDFGTEWVAAQQLIASHHALFANLTHLPGPIITYDNTNVVLEPNQISGIDLNDMAATRAHLASLGHDPSDYDQLVIFDLDPSNPAGGYNVYTQRYSVMRWFHAAQNGNVDVTQEQWNSFARAIYHHEMGHTHGWQHHWPNDPTPLVPELITSPDNYGWTDLDGDGVIEIRDQTPYGMTAPP